MAEQKMIDYKDLNLIHRIDDVETALELLKKRLPSPKSTTYPEIAKATFSGE